MLFKHRVHVKSVYVRNVVTQRPLTASMLCSRPARAHVSWQDGFVLEPQTLVQRLSLT